MNDLSTTCATGVAEALAERMGGVIDNGALAVMVSIGHAPGLFEMLSGHPAVTSAGPAAEAGLAERTVRERLAMTVSGRIVTYVPAPGRYGLPREHAAFLVKGAPPGNLAVFAQHEAILGKMQDAAPNFFETAEAMVQSEGFRSVERHVPPHDPLNVRFVARV